MTLQEPWYRLGYIQPHRVIDTAPYQFYWLAPPGMMLVLANLELADYTVEAVDHELPEFWRHATAMLKRQVNRIVLNGVPVSAALGRERVLALIEQGRERLPVPIDTDLEAIVQSMKHLGVERVALATRWHEALNDAVTRYLAHAGIEVIGRQASGRTMAENEKLTTAEGTQLALDLGRAALSSAPEAQGLLLPGGRWMGSEALPILEAEFGKPVFLNQTANIWVALHSAGYQTPITGRGKLLESLHQGPDGART